MGGRSWGGKRQTDKQPTSVAPTRQKTGMLSRIFGKSQPESTQSERDSRIKQKKAKKANRRRNNGVSKYQGNRPNRKVYTPIFRREINR